MNKDAVHDLLQAIRDTEDIKLGWIIVKCEISESGDERDGSWCRGFGDRILSHPEIDFSQLISQFRDEVEKSLNENNEIDFADWRKTNE